jgi:ligand-binding sensor domain-containing protein
VNKLYFHDLLVDQQGKVWIAGSAGVFQLRGSLGKFLAVPLETPNSRFMADTYFLKNGPGQGEALEYFKGNGFDGMHRLKLDDQGQLWGLSQKSMFRLDGMRWVPESLPNTERIMDASFRKGAASQLIWHNILSAYFMSIPTHELESWDASTKTWENASAKIAYGKEFNLAESYLFETRDQSVWLNSPLGMARKQYGQWQTFAHSPRTLVKPNGFIETQQGTIYAGDASKVWMFQDQDWMDVSADFPFPAEQFAEDKDGTLWIASHYSPDVMGRLAYRDSGGTWVTVEQPWNPGPDNNSIAHIGVTEKGEIFVVGRSRNYAIRSALGWQVYATDSWTSLPLEFPEFVPGRYIQGNLYLHDTTENDKNRFQIYRNQLIATRSGYGIYVVDGEPIEASAP